MKDDTSIPGTGPGNRAVAEGIAHARRDEEMSKQVQRLVYPMRYIGYQLLNGDAIREVSEVDVEMKGGGVELAWLINPGDGRLAILTFTRPDLDWEAGGQPGRTTAHQHTWVPFRWGGYTCAECEALGVDLLRHRGDGQQIVELGPFLHGSYEVRGGNSGPSSWQVVSTKLTDAAGHPWVFAEAQPRHLAEQRVAEWNGKSGAHPAFATVLQVNR
jgi:hypothetical protein